MSDDDTYEIPLQDQRVFGAGIKRKRVKFVPSSETRASLPNVPKQSTKSIQALYLNLVLPGEQSGTKESHTSASSSLLTSAASTQSTEPAKAPKPQVCDICNLPLTSNPVAADRDPNLQNVSAKSRPHEASLAHQVCLSHSHQPSHLDRNRKGLNILSSYGWDPDSRLGLGVSGQGIQFPIKAKPKDDTLGIGVVLPKRGGVRIPEKVTKLDAGKIRKMAEKDKKRGERLREMFYRNDDVEKYLGGG